jgi:hypothetical protein
MKLHLVETQRRKREKIKISKIEKEVKEMIKTFMTIIKEEAKNA